MKNSALKTNNTVYVVTKIMDPRTLQMRAWVCVLVMVTRST